MKHIKVITVAVYALCRFGLLKAPISKKCAQWN